MAQITITTPLSQDDRDLLAELLGVASVTPEQGFYGGDPLPKSEPVSSLAPVAKKAAPAKVVEPEPEPEPEEDEDVLGGAARTPDEALKHATALVGQGQSALIKKALAAVGVKRVGELKPDQVEAWFAALES